MGCTGRPKEYTPRKLRKAVNLYFDGITRNKTLTEPVPTGEKDKYGHQIFREEVVMNNLGEPMTVTEYLEPPSKGALAMFLGIHRSTWDNYHDREKYPELAQIVEEADARIQAWNEQQLLTRSGKDVRGIIFNLENNYGYRERLDAKVSGVGEYLAQLDEQGAEAAF